MRKFLIVTFWLLIGSTGHSETWFCAVHDQTAGPNVRKYTIDGGNLRDLSLEDVSKEMSAMCKCDYSAEIDYKIMLNDDHALIASASYQGLNSYNNREISLMSLIIVKDTGNLVLSDVMIRPPEQGETSVVHGSCKHEEALPR